MPTIGSVELLVVILVAFLVVGPRDLPRLMRTVGKWVHRVRVMATEFQHNLDAVVKEADLEDLKKDVDSIRREASEMKRSITTPLGPLEKKSPDPTDGKAPDKTVAGKGADE
jgi:sec-independent protein translocase protein TatB